MSTLLETTQTDPSVLAEARALIKIADDDGFPARTFTGTDFFDPNCAVVLPEQGTTGADEHPFGSYNITYPYCRTAIRVAVDDPDPNPLLAQVTSSSRYLSIRVTALVCGVETRLAGFRLLDTLPANVPICSVTSVVHPTSRQGYLVVDGSKVTLPLQALLQLVTVDGVSRTGWINVLPVGWVEP